MKPVLVAAAALLLTAPATAETLLGPSPYLSFADSPFVAVPFAQFVLQTFDSEGLDTSTVSASAGTHLTSGTLIDSVGGDGDDPGSWYSNNSTAISFDFTAFEALHGRLPTHAGLVWTDVGFRLSDGLIGGPSEVRFTGTDGLGNPFGTTIAFLGDGSAAGETAEDRFFGVVHLAGIRTITISMPDSADWEMDHLQYGAAVPEPATWAMLLAGFGLVGATARRRRQGIATA
jgi:hypothetical protein